MKEVLMDMRQRVSRGFLRFLPLILLLAFPFHAMAQRNSIDQAIDSYEAICNECISLKELAFAGNAVPYGALSKLLVKLSELRSLLSNSNGQMTRSQRLRMESIRLRYEEAFDQGKDSNAPQSALTDPLPNITHSSVILTSSAFSICNYAGLIGSDRRPHSAPGSISATPITAKPAPFMAIALGEFPRNYFGLMLAYSPGRIGGYLKGAMSPSVQDYSYDCHSDGMTADGGFIWTSGRERRTGYSVTSGLTFCLSKRLSVYAGGGYGAMNILWEDASGGWARVSDKSCSGISPEAGIILSFGRLRLLAGLSAITMEDTSAQIGIGLAF